jgi:hypothetical protein
MLNKNKALLSMIRGRADTDDSVRWMSDGYISSQEHTCQTDSTRSLTEPSSSPAPSEHFICELVDPTVENTPLSIRCVKLSSDLLSVKGMRLPGEDSEERDKKNEKRKKRKESADVRKNALIERISVAMVGALSDEPLTDTDMDSMNESFDIKIGEQQAPISPLSSQIGPILKTRLSSDALIKKANPPPREELTRASSQRSVFENSAGEGDNDKISAPPKIPERRTSSLSIEEAISRSGLIQDMDSETDDHDIARNRQARGPQHPLVHEQLPRASAEGDRQTKQDVMPMLPRRINSKFCLNGSITSEISKGESCLSLNPDLSLDPDSNRNIDAQIEHSFRSRTSGSISEMSTPSNIEVYVMERIPASVKAKLPLDAWHRIFCAAIEFAQHKAENPSLSSGADAGVSKAEERKSGIIVDQLLPSSEPLPEEDDDRSASVAASTSPIAIGASQSSVVVFNARETTRLAVSHKNKLRHVAKDLEVRGGAAPPPRPPSPSTPRHWGAGNLGEDSLKVPTRVATFSPPSASYMIPRVSEEMSKLFLKRGVSFDSVRVRHYARILVESPCISSGPAVGLGWSFEELPSMTLNEAQSISKEGPSSMLLTRREREAIVRDLGYSQREIAAAIRRSLKAKHQRRQTVLHLSNQNLEEIVENSTRKVKRILRFGSKERRRLNQNNN